ncbi:MAG: 16S rRNA (uracil(1498)-N(3))-methyltransferase [Nitrospirota bacterium]
MVRLFIDKGDIQRDTAIIAGENVKYIKDVLRCSVGDKITILNGHGNECKATISSIGRKEIRVDILRREFLSTEWGFEIVLCQGIPRGKKMDFIVQKSTEIGVKKIIPLLTERTVIRDVKGKVERWRRIAKSAAQQSGRTMIPEIYEAMEFESFLNSCGEDFFCMLFYEDAKRGIRTVLRNYNSGMPIIITVGPEGGFSPREVEMAEKRNFYTVWLGPRILKAETAPITILSIIGYELGEI